MFPSLAKIAGAIDAAPELNFLDSAEDGAPNTTYTFTNVITGFDTGERTVILVVYSSESSDTTAADVVFASVNNIEATKIGTFLGTGNEEIGLLFFAVTISGNTVDNVVITYSQSMPRAGFALWELKGASDPFSPVSDGFGGVTTGSELTIDSFAVEPEEVALLACLFDTTTIAEWSYTTGGPDGFEDRLDLEAVDGASSGVVTQTSAHTAFGTQGNKDGAIAILKWSTVIPRVQLVDAAEEGANQNTHNFGTLNFGEGEGLSRIVIAITSSIESIGINTLTIGDDVSTTVLYDPGGNRNVVFYIANPSGSSGNVTVAFDASSNSTSVLLWRINNMASLSVHDSDTARSTSSNATLNMALDIPADGICIGASIIQQTGNWRSSGAHDPFGVSQISHPVTVRNSGNFLTIWTGLTIRHDEQIEDSGSNSERGAAVISMA